MGSKEDTKIALEAFLREVMKDWGKSINKLLVKEAKMDGKELNAFLELILPPLRQHIADELERQLDGRMKTALEKNLVEMNDKLGHIVRLVGKINEK